MAPRRPADPHQLVGQGHCRFVVTDPLRRLQCLNSEVGRAMITRRFATLEPVFGNLRQNKHLDRFSLSACQPARARPGAWPVDALMRAP